MRSGLRCVGALSLAAAVLFLTWGRSTVDPIDPSAPVAFAPLAEIEGGEAQAGAALSLAGAWHLDSRNRAFGGYSALVALSDGSLLAGGDAGGLLAIAHPGTAEMAGRFPELVVTQGRDKRDADMESLTVDRGAGRIWAGYERSNAIERYDLRLNREARAQPPAMQGWSKNGGPEALVRLSDGRFVAIAEVRRRGEPPGHRAVLFDGDPAEGAAGRAFSFAAPAGMRPVDMTELPDGTVLVLLRSVERFFPPGFASAIAVMDPGGIEPGALWTPRAVLALPPGTPAENYEGLAAWPDEDGVRLWLISDDNFSGFQRTLLVALDWRG